MSLYFIGNYSSPASEAGGPSFNIAANNRQEFELHELDLAPDSYRRDHESSTPSTSRGCRRSLTTITKKTSRLLSPLSREYPTRQGLTTRTPSPSRWNNGTALREHANAPNEHYETVYVSWKASMEKTNKPAPLYDVLTSKVLDEILHALEQAQPQDDQLETIFDRLQTLEAQNGQKDNDVGEQLKKQVLNDLRTLQMDVNGLLKSNSHQQGGVLPGPSTIPQIIDLDNPRVNPEVHAGPVLP